jgi:hypothetical protein
MAREDLNDSLTFLDEAYSRGVVVEYRGGGLLFSKEHSTTDKTYWKVVEEAKRRDCELKTALSYTAVQVQQRARAAARDGGIAYCPPGQTQGRTARLLEASTAHPVAGAAVSGEWIEERPSGAEWFQVVVTPGSALGGHAYDHLQRLPEGNRRSLRKSAHEAITRHGHRTRWNRDLRISTSRRSGRVGHQPPRRRR